MKIKFFTNNLISNSKSNILNAHNPNNSFYFGNNSNTDTFSRKYIKGDNVENLGSIFMAPDIYNIETKSFIPCLLLYQTDDNNSCFRLIKNDYSKIKKLNSFFNNDKVVFNHFKQSSFSFTQNILNQIRENSPEIYELIKQLYIAEINYTTINQPEVLNKLNNLGYSKFDKNKDIICIQNFINYQKQYKYASRYVSINLLKKLLNENPNIVIKANAFGDNPISPINLYLRYGFLPLEKTNCSKFIPAKKRDIKEKVIMYLPPDAILYDIIKRIEIKPDGKMKLFA